MKSTLMMLSGAAVAMAGPVQNRDVDVVVETAVVVETIYDYYTVTQEFTSPSWPTWPPKWPSKPTTTENTVVVVTVTADATTSSTSSTTDVGNVAVAQATTSATSSAASSASTDTFSGMAVYHHNIHRSNHSASDIVYNDTLAGYAATVAASCVFAHDLSEGDGNYGQNIAMYASSDDAALDLDTAVAQAITDMWYNSELELYPGYGSEPSMSDFDGWGHFTQIVWKEQSSLGCAVQKCEPGTMESGMTAWYTVCNYYPPGKSIILNTVFFL